MWKCHIDICSVYSHHVADFTMHQLFGSIPRENRRRPTGITRSCGV